MRCHAHAGLHDLDGWTRNLFRPPLTLQAPEYRQLRLLRQQYLRRLEPFLERDRQIFAEAVRAATGLDAKEYARRYAAFWERYEDAKVDRAWAARDLGIAPETLRRALERQLKATGQLDPILAALLLEGDRRRSIGIRPWEEVYPLAATILRGGSIP